MSYLELVIKLKHFWYHLLVNFLHVHFLCLCIYHGVTSISLSLKNNTSTTYYSSFTSTSIYFILFHKKNLSLFGPTIDYHSSASGRWHLSALSCFKKKKVSSWLIKTPLIWNSFKVVSNILYEDYCWSSGNHQSAELRVCNFMSCCSK